MQLAPGLLWILSYDAIIVLQANEAQRGNLNQTICNIGNPFHEAVV